MRYDKTKTLFVSDLDGTLLDKNAILTDYSASVLRKLSDKGYNFTIATGRRWRTARYVLENKLSLTLPIVLMNGAAVYDTVCEKYIYIHDMPDDAVQSITALAMRNHVSARAYTVTGEPEDIISNALKVVDNEIHSGRIDNYGEITGHIMYFYFSGKYDEVKQIFDEGLAFGGIGGVISRDSYNDNNWEAELFNENASKGRGVRFLREKYGFTHVVSFGDNMNDLALFEECDECYAPENAMEQVKTVATGVIAANDKDGVARWLETHVL